MWLRDTEYRRSSLLGEFSLFDDGADLQRKFGLRQSFFRIGQTEISENIPASFGNRYVLMHGAPSLSYARHPLLPPRGVAAG